MEQRELLAEAKNLLETGDLFPLGTAEEPHTRDAEAEASDSEPEVHVIEPLADDHSSDGEDTSTGVEESEAPAAPAVAAAPEGSHQRDSISAYMSRTKKCFETISFSDELFLHIFFESSESDRFFQLFT